VSCLDKTLKIYEAGKMGGLSLTQMNEWRVLLKNRLNVAAENTGYNLVIINPVDFYNFQEKRHQSEIEIEDYDLAHVATSDIVIVNLEGLSSSDGTKIELFEANYNRKIPVIAFGERGLYEDLHPWIKNSITRVEDNPQDVVNYIRDFYMI
jgi:nucleoside 2-deoxyribosyltransferase